MKIVIPLLLSFNAHVWGVVAFSLVETFEVKDRKPEIPQVVELIRLDPASRTGEQGDLELTPRETKLPSVTPSQIPNPTPNQRPKLLPRTREPSVKYQVRVSRTESSLHDAREDFFRQSEQADRVRPHKASVRDQKKVRFVASAASLSVPGKEATLTRETPEQDFGPSHASALPQTSSSEAALAGGDTRPLLQIIQARINEITPLIHHTTRGCELATGLLRIRFSMGPGGYSHQVQLVSSSGNKCLDAQIGTILHMAEPYPYLEGWIPVYMKFQ